MVSTIGKPDERLNKGSQDSGQKVLCPSCGNKASLLVSKIGRFLFLGHNCGLQCFSRAELSEKWFAKLVRDVPSHVNISKLPRV